MKITKETVVRFFISLDSKEAELLVDILNVYKADQFPYDQGRGSSASEYADETYRLIDTILTQLEQE